MDDNVRIYTKQGLIDELLAIKEMGWVKSCKAPGNAGGVGNTLEVLLGITENNLPIPNATEWELKARRKQSGSPVTLFHMEPAPRPLRIVPRILLQKYGWRHELAGERYPESEMSFRQTISTRARSDRGFTIIFDKEIQQVRLSFDANSVDIRHADWLKSVEMRAGLAELDPSPYWGFDTLYHKAGTKLPNLFYVVADSRREDGCEYFRYESILMLTGFDRAVFENAIEAGILYADFDARTGHNHGTKFRLRENELPLLYENRIVIE